jgi:hypothetical protein
MRSIYAFFFAFFFALSAASAAAQDAEKKATTPAPEHRPLNLKLDNPGRWATVAPDAEKEEKQALPGLGENARPMPTEVPRSDSRTVYPKDTQPAGR